MHPAPSLSEAFPKSEDSRGTASQPSPTHSPEVQDEQQRDGTVSQAHTLSQLHLEAQDHQHLQLAALASQQQKEDEVRHQLTNGHSMSPISPGPHGPRNPLPVRKDTGSSISSNLSDATITSNASNGTDSSAYSVESSQSIFSVKDGAEISGSRRASRRRTGPLSAQQREKAALIRKLGACIDCRRRRVACHPNHHNMTWEDAMRKYRSHSPPQDLAPLAGRPMSPGAHHTSLAPAHNEQEGMELDSSPTPPAHQPNIRTPLPSGPRLDKMPPLAAAPLPPPTTLPNIDFIKSELETSASRILSGPNRNRYSRVHGLIICWQDDDDPTITSAVDGLGDVLDKYYNFNLEVVRIPQSTSDRSSSRWLSRIINDFADNADTRDVLKLVYYIGDTFLDENREMVLASYQDRDKISTIRWGGIQQTLEEARSDTLIMIDAAYYHPAKIVRHRGVLELIAASTSESHYNMLGRANFSRVLTEVLRSRVTKRYTSVLSVAELYSEILAAYSKVMGERYPEQRDAVSKNSPTPLHLQVSSNTRLPSITLSPLQQRTPVFSPDGVHGSQLNLSIRLNEDTVNIESWNEWFRLMPDEIKDVKVDGPYRTFR